MSEGELKQRITRFLDNVVNDTPTAKKAMVDVIKEILEEAKKSFPLKLDENGVYHFVIPESKADLVALVDWFLKWFGEF